MALVKKALTMMALVMDLVMDLVMALVKKALTMMALTKEAKALTKEVRTSLITKAA